MTRTESLALWASIAAGGLESEQDGPIDLHPWIRGVALSVSAADGVPDAVRPGTIIDALGLSGRRDHNAQLREFLKVVEDFPFVKDGEVRGPARSERMQRLILAARVEGLTGEHESDVDARKRIERLLPGKSRDRG